jgi:hypothetical protein
MSKGKVANCSRVFKEFLSGLSLDGTAEIHGVAEMRGEHLSIYSAYLRDPLRISAK